MNNISFSAESGEILGLIGENGAGKSTTFRMMATMLTPGSGKISIAGYDTHTYPAEVRRSIGILFGQQSGLYERLSARENILYFADLNGMPRSQALTKIPEISSLLGMEEFLDRRAGTFSTGMRQKTLIARAIIHDPKVLLLDEPASGLDVTSSKNIHDFIRWCKEQNKTVLFSSHDLSAVETISDRILVLKQGRLVAEGAPDKIKGNHSLEEVFFSTSGEFGLKEKKRKIISIVAQKELKDFFRDPRSLILSLGLPLILFPLLFWVLNENPQPRGAAARVYRIALEKPASLPRQIGESPYFTLSAIKTSERSRWHYSHDALVTGDREAGSLRIHYDNTDPISVSAYHSLEKILTGGTESGVEITGRTGTTSGMGSPLFSEEYAAGTVFLGMILPFMFFVFAVTCPLAGAADLSSGEKERGSLEPLLSTAASRTGIVLGKLTAGSVTGLCSVGAYFLGCYLSYLITPEIIGQKSISFSTGAFQITLLILQIVVLTLLFTAIEITAGFLTRSVREAQLLAMPLLMIGMGAVYVAQNIDLTGKPWYFVHIPLVNLALAIRETALNRIIPEDILWAFAWSLVYLLLLSILAVSMFHKDFSFVKTGKTKRLLDRLPGRRYSK